MKKVRTLAMTNAFSCFIQAGLFYIIQFQLLNQPVVTQITDPYHSWLVPQTGIVLKIWGVIYTALAIFCLYHLRMAYSRPEKHNANNDTLRVDIFFIINNLAAAGWLLAVAYDYSIVSLLLLGTQLFLVLIIHRRLGIYKRDRRARTNFCTQMPLSLYAGWLFMTVMAGIGQYIGLSGILQTIIFIGIIAFISLLIIFIRNNIFFSLVVMAGLYGFITKIELYKSGSYDIILATWISIGTLAIASFIKLIIDFRIKESSELFQRAAFH